MIGRKKGILNRVLLVLIMGLILSGSTLPCSLPAEAGAEVEIGGELKAALNSVITGEEVDAALEESLRLEIFLPGEGSSEGRLELEVYNPPRPQLVSGSGSGGAGPVVEEKRYFFKKLYLRQRYPDFHLTVGRQPISWSFGSLFNPADYNPGAVAGGEETPAKYLDAVEGYIPLNWNSSLSLVAGFPGGFASGLERAKWGIRGRAGYKNYDLTSNYVREPGGLAERLGLTVKGDLGINGVGVYAGAAYYLKQPVDGERLSLVAGLDYSFFYDYFKRITMQAEYLSLADSGLGLLGGLAGGGAGVNPGTGGGGGSNSGRSSFLTGTVSCPVDDFSSLSLLALVSLDDGSLLLGPVYQNQLDDRLELTVRGAAGLGSADSLFGPRELIPGQGKTVGQLSLSLSYLF